MRREAGLVHARPPAEVVDVAAAAAGAGAGVEDALPQFAHRGLDGLLARCDGGGGDVDRLAVGGLEVVDVGGLDRRPFAQPGVGGSAAGIAPGAHRTSRPFP